MLIEQARAFVEQISKLIELAGVGVILVGIVLATAIYFKEVRSAQFRRQAYARFRSNLGRGILLGLELLVAADIISTITAPLTFESVALLGLIVVIRTFLSFSLETEIEGCAPWNRARLNDRGAGDER